MRPLHWTLAGAALLCAVVAGAPDALAQGCAMCRTTLEGQEHDPLTAAINTSVLFMMVMPYVVVGTVGGWIVLASRRRGAGASADRPPAAEPTQPEQRRPS